MSDGNGYDQSQVSSLRERLLQVPLRKIPVDIPDYPRLWLREQTVAGRYEYEEFFLKRTRGKGMNPEDEVPEDDRQDFITALVIRHLSDEHGQLLFKEDEIEVMRAALSWSVIKYLYDRCSELFNWTAKLLGEAEKELEADPLATPSND